VTDLALAPPRRPSLLQAFPLGALVNGFFWLTVASGSIVFVEPSPYDLLFLITLMLWLARGFTLHRATTPFLLLLSLWVLGGYISLIPYWNEADPVDFMVHTLFIATTGVFYALFTAQDTRRRLGLLLNAYTFSCVIAAAIAVVSWFGAFGAGEDWIKDGRAMAPFKDPNVLGSYLVLGALTLTQRLLLGRLAWLWLALPSLGLILAALFLSFSRGSWGAMILATAMIAGFLIGTADSDRMRLRVIGGAVAVVLLAAGGLLAALSVDTVREFFFQRAAVTQDYDQGPNGRFGNQIRSIPMLIDRPNGFGPLRYRLIFELEPHNSYINAFASNGWLGGFAFLLLVGATTFVGFRQSLTRHPYMRPAQLLFATTFVFFLQGLQIDLDHWRMFYVSLGAVWGVEAARQKWLGDARRARISP
jgi:O-antigen ligase